MGVINKQSFLGNQKKEEWASKFHSEESRMKKPEHLAEKEARCKRLMMELQRRVIKKESHCSLRVKEQSRMK